MRHARRRLWSNGPRSSWAGWLVVLYVGASLLADGAHSHVASHGHTPTAQKGCDDPGSHWASHQDTPDLSCPADLCAACHHRAAHPHWPEQPWSRTAATSRIEGHPGRPGALPVALRSVSSRGPPLA